MSILLTLLTGVLIIISLFLILVVLAQKSKDGGMGATLGGGAAEAAFGAETGNVLSKSTIWAAVIFFVLAFVLYLGRIYERTHANATPGSLPNITAPATSAVTPAPAAGTPSPAVSLPSAAPAGTAPAATTAPAAPAPADATKAAPEAEKKN